MPTLIIAPVVCVAANKLPARANVERAAAALARVSRSEPRRGISRRWRHHPLWLIRLAQKHESVPVAQFSYAKNEADAFDQACLRGEPRRGQVRSDSPIMCMGSNGWITPKAWDYSAEPPSHWTSQSPGIQRYEHSNMAGDELRLLSLIGSQVYRLSDPTIQTPGHAFA